jgi:DNA mismatch repair protein MutL
MADIIQLLPDSVANQIAAGEVIQRPASVVKELVENSIDAKATSITINIKDAGRTLIQIIDNGTGMSETDARLSFERHATSKIRKAEDLFSITTMGFRGEALASIAAVASVDVKTRLAKNETGTNIVIEGSVVLTQDPVSCAPGTIFTVKNLFYNIPARRKFLKSNTTEFGHILSEFERIALANPEVEFKLYHNDSQLFNLPRGNTRQRIVAVFGKKTNQNLVAIEAETSIINVRGFIGKPENARKKSGEQFFFINNRFMRNPYLHKAIVDAYKNILQPESVPSYFLYLEAAPETIDVNIHPTKTEIKFEDQQAVWQIIHATVKQSLGKNNIVPSIDFDVEQGFDIPVLTKNTEIKKPFVEINPYFNPFDEKPIPPRNQNKSISLLEKENLANWEKLYEGFENEKNLTDDFVNANQSVNQQKTIDSNFSGNYFQFKNKYILTPVKSGLMIIDQKKAHERILFEKFMFSLESKTVISQRTLFPKTIELSHKEHSLILGIIDDIRMLGFDISDIGNNSLIVNGLPADSSDQEPEQIIDKFLHEYLNTEIDIKTRAKEKIAQSLAKASAISSNQSLTSEEMSEIVDLLFACSVPNFSPFGKKIISILKTEEIEKRFS